MAELTQGFRAVVIGATGGIGSGFVEKLHQHSSCGDVIGLSRSTTPALDLTDEASIEAAATSIGGEVDLVIDATGFLSDGETQPEKSLRALNVENFARLFAINATGPALIMKHFLPLLPRDRHVIFATLSARVGSIGDNGLGGWYAYRASKAALNQIVRCASIEIGRKNKQSLVVSLHPGTVETGLSDPFASDRDRLSPQKSASMMLDVLFDLAAEETGSFWDYRGERIEW